MAYLWLTSENAILPGCRVNKGKKKGRSLVKPECFAQYLVNLI
jgi:hypothetical protein